MKNRFPRTRGDVPCNEIVGNAGLWFPPHTRGCTGARDTR